MSELSKLITSALLLAAGFFGASLFGPPELAQRLARHWSAPSAGATQGLQPLAPGEVLASRTLPPEPAPFAPPADVRPTVAKRLVPTGAVQTTWTTPDFSNAAPGDVASPAPSGDSPSADFNAWLGSAGEWLRGQPGDRSLARPPEAAPRVDSAIAHAGGPTAPGAVEWLPPRRAEPEPQSAPPGGPSLFAGDAPAPVVRSQNSIGVDDWSRPSTESFGAPPAAPWSAQPWSAQRWPSAAVESTYQPVARDVGGGFDTHVVTDGDTLPLLAERRLGDASRAAEIFQLNRELLESPDLLPIGVVLRLPRESRRPSPTAGAMRDRAPGPTPF